MPKQLSLTNASTLVSKGNQPLTRNGTKKEAWVQSTTVESQRKQSTKDRKLCKKSDL